MLWSDPTGSVPLFDPNFSMATAQFRLVNQTLRLGLIIIPYYALVWGKQEVGDINTRRRISCLQHSRDF